MKSILFLSFSLLILTPSYAEDQIAGRTYKTGTPYREYEALEEQAKSEEKAIQPITDQLESKRAEKTRAEAEIAENEKNSANPDAQSDHYKEGKSQSDLEALNTEVDKLQQQEQTAKDKVAQLRAQAQELRNKEELEKIRDNPNPNKEDRDKAIPLLEKQLETAKAKANEAAGKESLQELNEINNEAKRIEAEITRLKESPKENGPKPRLVESQLGDLPKPPTPPETTPQTPRVGNETPKTPTQNEFFKNSTTTGGDKIDREKAAKDLSQPRQYDQEKIKNAVDSKEKRDKLIDGSTDPEFRTRVEQAYNKKVEGSAIRTANVSEDGKITPGDKILAGDLKAGQTYFNEMKSGPPALFSSKTGGAQSYKTDLPVLGESVVNQRTGSVSFDPAQAKASFSKLQVDTDGNYSISQNKDDFKPAPKLYTSPIVRNEEGKNPFGPISKTVQEISQTPSGGLETRTLDRERQDFSYTTPIPAPAKPTPTPTPTQIPSATAPAPERIQTGVASDSSGKYYSPDGQTKFQWIGASNNVNYYTSPNDPSIGYRIENGEIDRYQVLSPLPKGATKEQIIFSYKSLIPQNQSIAAQAASRTPASGTADRCRTFVDPATGKIVRQCGK